MKEESLSRKEKLEKLRNLIKEHDNMNDFAKKACEENLTVSMSEGRRIYNQFK